MTSFSKRSNQKELIDDLNCDGDELRQTLRELKTINKLLGGNQVTTGGIGKLLSSSRPKEVSIADVGCGLGEVILLLFEWGQKKQIYDTFIDLDANANNIARFAAILSVLPMV